MGTSFSSNISPEEIYAREQSEKCTCFVKKVANDSSVRSEDLSKVCTIGDLLLTQEKTDVVGGVATHMQIVQAIQAAGYGGFLETRKRKVSAWNMVSTIVRRKNSADKIVLCVTKEGIIIEPLKEWLASQSRGTIVALRSMNASGHSLRYESSLIDIVESLYNANGVNASVQSLCMRWGTVVEISKLEQCEETEIGEEESKGGVSSTRGLGWLKTFIERLRSILFSPPSGFKVAAMREFFILDSDDSGTLDMLETCKLISRLHSASNAVIPTERALHKEVEAIWEACGKQHEEGLTFSEFLLVYQEKRSKSRQEIDVGHDILHIASGEFLYAYLSEIGAVPTVGEEDIVTYGYYTASSFSNASDFSNERIVSLTQGFDLTDEIRVVF